jgi:hypothetical protein
MWAGEPFNKIDAALLALRIQQLSEVAGALWGEMTEYEQRFITKFQAEHPSPLSGDNQKKLERLITSREETREEEERYRKMLAFDAKSYMPVVLDELAERVLKNNINPIMWGYGCPDVSDEELEFIRHKISNTGKKLACQTGSLIPANHLPLVECNSTKNSDGSLSVELRLPEYNVMDLFARDILRDLATTRAEEKEAQPDTPNL